jgi:putative radical SAM enzyme (TIGR03279 family)
VEKKHVIKSVNKGSIADSLGILPGDIVIKIDDNEIEDIFDYQFMTLTDELVLTILRGDEEWEYEIEKGENEDIGLVFENGLMDNYRRCSNNCIFCFIDQMPPGMRDTLYFKDDDSRLSFLQGNYITLTNLSEKDLGRIVRYNLSPVNVSIHTMNPELRCRMLGNRFAGSSLQKLNVLADAGIEMNGQVVLCKGINDGRELEFTISELMKYIPSFRSLSVVPVGLSKYRDGLFHLEPFEKDDCAEVIDIIEGYQKQCMEKYGIHFVHASDEFYLTAGRPMPEADRYDGYLQLDNGVGMIRSFIDERDEQIEKRMQDGSFDKDHGGKHITLVTGVLAYPIISESARMVEERANGLKIDVYAIRNDFFGERITVSGLLTGQDIIAQLKGRDLGDEIRLPESVVRAGTDVFLDDIKVSEVSDALQVRVVTIKSNGYDFVDSCLGMD